MDKQIKIKLKLNCDSHLLNKLFHKLIKQKKQLIEKKQVNNRY